MNRSFRNSFTQLSFFFLAVPILFIAYNCTNDEPVQKGDPKYLAEIEQWHAKRIERLKGENSWLNLAVLFWLKEGENKFGSASSNDLIFPKDKSPDFIGTLILKDNIVSIKVAEGLNVTANDKPVTELQLKDDLSDNPTILKLGSLKWYAVKRGDRFGIRLRDLESDLVKNFTGIERFPVNDKWKISASFVPFEKPKIISIPTIIGTPDEMTCKGELHFKIDGKDYSILPVDEDGKLFIIFADETNGEETYGAGRFLYADPPDSTGKVIIDFNKAYNPPCIFTPYATCPLPPKENVIRTKITAGEKLWGKGH